MTLKTRLYIFLINESSIINKYWLNEKDKHVFISGWKIFTMVKDNWKSFFTKYGYILKKSRQSGLCFMFSVITVSVLFQNFIIIVIILENKWIKHNYYDAVIYFFYQK